MADIRELFFSIGKKKQASLTAPLLAADMLTLGQINQDVWIVNPGQESNVDDMGKGTPFATQQFKTGLDGGGPWNAYLTSQNAAMLGAFGVGLVSKVQGANLALDSWIYTCEPAALFVDGDMPVTTVAQVMRQGATDIYDHAFHGVACNEFEIQLNSGIGRQNSQMTSNWLGTGKFAKPSTITVPTPLLEALLNAGGATSVTINGVDYKTTARFVTMRFRYSNNIRADYGYFPGSGLQTGYQLRGRLRRGNPVAEFEIVGEYVDGSPELDNVINQTEGTATITIAGATIGAGPDTHKISLVLHRIVPLPIVSEPQDGIVAIRAPFTVMEHPTNGVFTMEVTTNVDDIGTAAV